MPNNIPRIEPWQGIQWDEAGQIWEDAQLNRVLGNAAPAPAPDPFPPPQPAGRGRQTYFVPVYDAAGINLGSVQHDRPEIIHLEDLDPLEAARVRSRLPQPRAGDRAREPRWDPGNILVGRERDVKSGWKDFDEDIGSVFKHEGYATDKAESFIGLELENETQTAFNLPQVAGWRHHTEGSLRNFGFEYVQGLPARVPDSLALCGNMLKALKKNAAPQELLNTSRTSTHVHFDVTKYNFKDVLTFACTYWILEGYLSHFCGQVRQGNLYCLRLKDSAAIQLLIKAAIAEGAPWGMPLSRNDYRYSSLNFASIPKFGSLEFRMMAGTDKIEDIETWVHALDNIKKFALKFSNPTELGKFFVHNCEARQFPRTVLGSELAHKITSRIHQTPSQIEQEIRSGFMMVYPLIAAHGTWDFSKEIAAEKEALKAQKAAQKAAREVEEARINALMAARANSLPVLLPPVGPDEMNDNVDEINLVEVFEIADE